MLANKTVLITGASSGIGAALAKEFYSRGANLVLLARRMERLKLLAAEFTGAGKVAYFVCDVTHENDLKEAVAMAKEKMGSIDIVVANAGFGVAGNIDDLELADFQRQFETNVFGVLRTLYATLDDLKKSQGQFVVVGSVVGYLALPGNSAYAMSKFAVRGLADSLYHEAKKFGVSVTHVAPGFVRSEIRQVDNLGVHHSRAREPLPNWIQMPTEKAARCIANGIEKKKREIVITGHGKFAVSFQRHFPGLFSLLIRVFSITARPPVSLVR